MAKMTAFYSQRRSDAAVVTKHSLAFILDSQHSQEHHHHERHLPPRTYSTPPPYLLPPRNYAAPPAYAMPTRSYANATPPVSRLSIGGPILCSDLFRSPHTQIHRHPSKRLNDPAIVCKPRTRKCTQSTDAKRLARQCKVDGCANYTIDRGLCFRHGGGKTCSLDGCERSAKARGLCWRHGGSIRCSVAECPRGAKSRGLCWSHGGGKRCARAECDVVVTKRRATLCDHHQLDFHTTPSSQLA